VELLAPSGAVVRAASQNARLKPGLNHVRFRLADYFTGPKAEDEKEQFQWTRLQYSVSASESAESVSGLISASQLLLKTFSLQAIYPRNAESRQPFEVYVFARGLDSNAGVGGIEIEATLRTTRENDEGSDEHVDAQTLRGRTGPYGDTTLTFQFPDAPEDADIDLVVTARRGREIRKIEESIDNDPRSAHVILMTDKPIYQPGQALNIRALVLGPSRAPLAGKQISINVTEPGSTTAFDESLKTSRYGEAHATWRIPENARQGNYEIRVWDSKGDFIQGEISVPIRPYELPNFGIEVLADRPYYLPGQDAAITVDVRYLFGQPMPGARVKIVEAGEPQQDRDGSTHSPFTGVADANGRFTATLPQLQLPPVENAGPRFYRSDFARYGSLLQYSDVEYIAYVTDPINERTEERRFAVRRTRDPIHVFMTTPHRLGPNAPTKFYIVTQYADGSPASCDVEVRFLPPWPDSDGMDRAAIQKLPAVAVIKTSRFGVAEVAGIPGPVEFGSYALEAHDDQGNRGWTKDTPRLDEEDLEIETDKIAYAAGEAIRANIRSTSLTGPVILELLGNRQRLQSQVVYLQDGQASAVFAYSEQFQGRLSIVALHIDNAEDAVVKAVDYPARRLELEAVPERAVYAPGEEARVSFHVRSGQGAPEQSLLGIAVRDRAVDERADQSISDFLGRDAFAVIESARGEIGRGQLLPDDLRIAFEFSLLQHWSWGRLESADEDVGSPSYVFLEPIHKQLEPLRKALTDRYRRDFSYPTDDASLRRILEGTNIDPFSLRDPWGQHYRFIYSSVSHDPNLQILTAGPDKRPETDDDFNASPYGPFMSWKYFAAHGDAMGRAVAKYRERTGTYVRDMATLRAALREAGEDIDTWRDPWEKPYEFNFGVSGTYFTVEVTPSAEPGKNRRAFGQGPTTIWTYNVDYTVDLRRKVGQAITEKYRKTGQFPAAAQQFFETLDAAGIPEGERTDVWGHPYYTTFETAHEYANSLNVQNVDLTYAQYLDLERSRRAGARVGQQGLVPVTAEVQRVALKSAGPDGIQGNADDFFVGRLSRIVSVRSSEDSAPKPVENAPIVGTEKGALRIAVDGGGLAVSGVKATLIDAAGMEQAAVPDASNVIVFEALTPGYYSVLLELAEFSSLHIHDIPVRPGATLSINALMRRDQSGDMGTTLHALQSLPMVGGDPLQLITTLPGYRANPLGVGGLPMMMVNTVRDGVETQGPRDGDAAKSPVRAGPGAAIPTITPRLRDYFPETVFWQPALETDRAGNAEARFKLADNITTWKVVATASTLDGRMATAEAEIFAFQDFFLEHDPPRILTEGDKIALPVTIRSYLDKDQSLDVTLKPEPWFAAAGPLEQKTTVKAGEAKNVTFDFKAVTPVKDGKQRVTALGAAASDQIEKPITVRPNGREVVNTQSRIFKGDAAFALDFPTDTLAGTSRGEIRIYPDLAAHIVNAIEGILERPHGCAEQVISAAYPSLFLLRYEKQSGKSFGPASQKARRYLEEGYARLIAFQSADGSFGYWGDAQPDGAVTAYAVQFLADATGFADVNEDALRRAASWLIRTQRPDGAWTASRSAAPGSTEEPFRVLTLTSLVARSLSMPEVRKLTATPAIPGTAPKRDAVGEAIAYARTRAAQWGEPYALASLALAALQRKDNDTATWALARLESSVHREGDGVYWDLQSNSPFFGWGLPGRVESSSLVVRALAEGMAAGIGTAGTPALIDAGLTFLLRSKDRYGVWYSTQATVRALDALTRLALDTTGKSRTRGSGSIEIVVNGVSVETVALPRDGRTSSGPIIRDVSRFLRPGANAIELRGTGSATAQAVQTYYAPWNGPIDAKEGASRLQLQVRFDKTQGAAGDTFTALVHAERIGFRGYGMMIAEIGLPPGIDIDRNSLDQARRESAGLFRYEILPDRVVMYLWPEAGGSDFAFKFRARYGIDALTAASLLYDYYNPEANAAQPPTRFTVR
jgi:hypothetical protein